MYWNITYFVFSQRLYVNKNILFKNKHLCFLCLTNTLLHCRCGSFLWQHWRHDWVPPTLRAQVLLVIPHSAHLHSESSHLSPISLTSSIYYVSLFLFFPYCVCVEINVLLSVSSHLWHICIYKTDKKETHFGFFCKKIFQTLWTHTIQIQNQYIGLPTTLFDYFLCPSSLCCMTLCKHVLLWCTDTHWEPGAPHWALYLSSRRLYASQHSFWCRCTGWVVLVKYIVIT